MKSKRKLAPSKYLRRYGKAKTAPVITKEEVEAVLECEITDERFEELLEASRTYSLSNSDKHVNLAQDAEHNRDWEGAKKHWKNAALASIKHDAHKGTNRSDKLKVRGITMRKEEVEQIDELSKKTLGSYVKKAEQSADYHTHHFSHYVKRTTPEGKYNKKAVEHHAKKFHKRTLGIKRATKKIEESHGISLANKQIAHEAVELSASRKIKVNALLAKHQAKGLPAKPSKKYTREYTGDGLPQIMATINQEETINETKE